MQAVATAPTTVYFDVEDSFYRYAGGIYNTVNCGASTNHASEFELRDAPSFVSQGLNPKP